MEFLSCFIAITVGLAFAGFISGMWAAVFEEQPHIGLLEEGGFWAPIKGLILAFSAPIGLIFAGAEAMDEGPFAGTLYMIAGLGLSLVQGVVILTLFPGVV